MVAIHVGGKENRNRSLLMFCIAVKHVETMDGIHILDHHSVVILKFPFETALNDHCLIEAENFMHSILRVQGGAGVVRREREQKQAIPIVSNTGVFV